MTVQEVNEWLIELKGSEEILEFYYADNFKEALDMAIQALEEVKQYRALGTVEELKEAREKQMAKKVIVEDDGDSLLCPSCGLELMGSINDPDHDPYYCFECGQALKWGEEE